MRSSMRFGSVVWIVRGNFGPARGERRTVFNNKLNAETHHPRDRNPPQFPPSKTRKLEHQFLYGQEAQPTYIKWAQVADHPPTAILYISTDNM